MKLTSKVSPPSLARSLPLRSLSLPSFPRLGSTLSRLISPVPFVPDLLRASRMHKGPNTNDVSREGEGGGYPNTGISSEIRTKLRDRAVWQARAGCFSQAALSSNDSKML